MTDTRKWCYQGLWNDEQLEGPFDSREKVIAAARVSRDGGRAEYEDVTIGRVRHWEFRPDYIDFDTVLEHVEEQSSDDEWDWVEGTIVVPRPHAKEAFDALMKLLFTSSHWTIDQETVEIVKFEDL